MSRDYERQDLIDCMGWLRKRPRKERKHTNPERTYFNRVSYVTIFLRVRLKTRYFCLSIIWNAPAMSFCAAQRRATRLRCDKETAAFQLISGRVAGRNLSNCSRLGR